MTKNLDSEGLKSIAENYDLFYIDLWGVMHNGIELHEDAIYTLKKLLDIDKNFVRAVSNIMNIDVLSYEGLNVYDIIRKDNLVIIDDAIKSVEERLLWV